jgi:hypothetical protein
MSENFNVQILNQKKEDFKFQISDFKEFQRISDFKRCQVLTLEYRS